MNTINRICDMCHVITHIMKMFTIKDQMMFTINLNVVTVGATSIKTMKEIKGIRAEHKAR